MFVRVSNDPERWALVYEANIENQDVVVARDLDTGYVSIGTDCDRAVECLRRTLKANGL